MTLLTNVNDNFFGLHFKIRLTIIMHNSLRAGSYLCNFCCMCCTGLVGLFINIMWSGQLCPSSHVNFKLFKNKQMWLGSVSCRMSCERVFLCESFAAFVALERLLPRVRPHVALQMTRLSESVVALVALEWFFSCVQPHHVNF